MRANSSIRYSPTRAACQLVPQAVRIIRLMPRSCCGVRFRPPNLAAAKFGGLNLTPQQLRGINRIILTACGTSWHAALVGEYLIEELARIPVEVEYASELRYRNPPPYSGPLLFA